MCNRSISQRFQHGGCIPAPEVGKTKGTIMEMRSQKGTQHGKHFIVAKDVRSDRSLVQTPLSVKQIADDLRVILLHKLVAFWAGLGPNPAISIYHSRSC